MNANLPGKELDPTRLKTSVISLTIVLVISSIVGVFIAGFLSLVASTPLSVFVLPAVITMISAAVGLGVFAVPIWGLLGGTLFASGAVNGLRSQLNVTLLPDSDPIAERIQQLARKLDLPPVKYIGYYEGEEVNAFAAGLNRNAAMVAFTKGAVSKLSREQFDAVMAHEVGHIANNDMRRMTYARSFQNALTWFLLFQSIKRLARWLFTLASELGILALSRSREYRADAIASVLVSPEAMIGALQAIAADQNRPPRKQRRHANLMFRANPANLFSTHPPVADRIRAIRTAKYSRNLPMRPIAKPAVETVTTPPATEAFVTS